MRCRVLIAGPMLLLLPGCGARAGVGGYPDLGAEPGGGAGGSTTISGGSGANVPIGGRLALGGFSTGGLAAGGAAGAGTGGEDMGGGVAGSGGTQAVVGDWEVIPSPFPPPMAAPCCFSWSQPAPDLFLVWTSAANDVWIAASTPNYKAPPTHSLIHWDGSAWEKFYTSVRIASLSGVHPNDLWSAGGEYASSNRKVSHWTGSDWSHAEGQGELIWENSSTDIWLCCRTSTGAAGVSVQEIQHWDGARWSSVALPEPTRAVRDLWSDPDELWLLDERGIVLRWDGIAWSELPVRRDEQINAIWGDGDGRLWAAGTLGLVVRYEGGAWSVSHTGGNDLKDIWGSSSGAIRAVGASGTVLRWGGSAWRPEVSGTTSQLNAIWGSSAENVWIAGNQAVILRKRS